MSPAPHKVKPKSAKRTRWSKPKPTVGNRMEIHSDDKKFCITKENQAYTAMQARGSIWVVLGKFATLDEAKQTTDKSGMN